MVGLTAAYSKRTDHIKTVRRVADLAGQEWPERPPTPACPSFFDNQRLGPEQLDELVTAYNAGATGQQLAESYSLARSTVIQLLKKQGVQVRYPRVSPEDAALAVELYRQGLRQIDIAAQLGRSKTAIWHVLRRAGVL